MTSALVIGAHPDDEVLGAGATIARLASEGVDVHVAIVTDGCSTQYPGQPELIAEKKVAAKRALEILGGKTIHFGDLPDMKLDTLPLVEVNAFLERVVATIRPEIVFTHNATDLNRDHRIVHEASLVACRAFAGSSIREMMAYDVLGVTNFAGVSSAFLPDVFYACEAFLARKIAALHAYSVEVRAFPHPRSPEAIEAQGRVYGVLSGTSWAEAFTTIRSVR